MSTELIDDGAGDPRNARFLALAADLAYHNEPQGPAAFKEKLGLDAKLISVGNTQVYVAQSPKAVVVAFRGTESPASLEGIKDWLLTNANNFLILPEGELGTDFAAAGVGARFHRGFMQALAAIWDPLFAAVQAAQKQSERPLWLTGHSLGGALALLAAWRLQMHFLAVHQVYTFGAPMIGNPTAAASFAREFPDRIYRYIDKRDIVPLLPTISLIANEYSHCLAEVALSDAAAAAADELKQAAGDQADKPMSPGLADLIFGRLKDGFAAHLMNNYCALIEEKCKANA